MYRRRQSDLLMNVITVHNYQTSLSGSVEEQLDEEVSVQEQRTLLVEETKATDISGAIMSDIFESHTMQSKKQAHIESARNNNHYDNNNIIVLFM